MIIILKNSGSLFYAIFNRSPFWWKRVSCLLYACYWKWTAGKLRFLKISIGFSSFTNSINYSSLNIIDMVTNNIEWSYKCEAVVLLAVNTVLSIVSEIFQLNTSQYCIPKLYFKIGKWFCVCLEA